MRTARTTGESNIYHVVTRGTGQQMIFETNADRRRYLDTLHELLAETGGELLAWCLMENHVHLLIRQPIDRLSTTMRRLDSGYALYFNMAHGRSGHLFQGRFLSEPVETDEYLKTVVRYIHQNPVKAGMTAGCSYPWSSYDVYACGNCPAADTIVLDLLGGAEGFRAFHGEADEADEVAGAAACIDVVERGRRMSDEQALEVALSLFGDAGLGEIKSLSRGQRDAALATLKAHRLTVRQIQRLTGVSLGVISRA